MKSSLTADDTLYRLPLLTRLIDSAGPSIRRPQRPKGSLQEVRKKNCEPISSQRDSLVSLLVIVAAADAKQSKKMADVSASNTTEVPTEDPAKVQHDKPAETESSGEGGESQTAEADNGKGPNPDKLSDEEMAAIIDRLARSQEASEASAKKGEQIPSTPSGSRMMVKQGESDSLKHIDILPAS